MAKKRRGTKRRSSRRRVGGFGKLNASNPIVKFGSVAAGYFLGSKVNDMIDKVAGDKIDDKMLAAIQVLAGGAVGGQLPIGKKKARPLPLVVVGGILAGAGVKRGLTAFGVINGFSDVPVLGGYRSVPALNGYNPTPGANLGGYRVPSSVMGNVPNDGTGNAAGSGVNADGRN